MSMQLPRTRLLYRIYGHHFGLIFDKRQHVQCDRNHIIHALNGYKAQSLDDLLWHVYQVVHITFGQDERLNARAVGC